MNYLDLLRNCKKVKYTFPTKENSILHFNQHKVVDYANSTYPVMHSDIYLLMKRFLKLKKKYGSDEEKGIYRKMGVKKFIDRLLTKPNINHQEEYISSLLSISGETRVVQNNKDIICISQISPPKWSGTEWNMRETEMLCEFYNMEKLSDFDLKKKNLWYVMYVYFREADDRGSKCNIGVYCDVINLPLVNLDSSLFVGVCMDILDSHEFRWIRVVNFNGIGYMPIKHKSIQIIFSNRKRLEMAEGMLLVINYNRDTYNKYFMGKLDPINTNTMIPWLQNPDINSSVCGENLKLI